MKIGIRNIVTITFFALIFILPLFGGAPNNPKQEDILSHDNISYLSKLFQKAVSDSAWPGGVLLASKDGDIFYHEAVGFHTYKKEMPTKTDDIFDLASVTKVIATTSAIMKLYEEGLIDLDDPVQKHLPQFRGNPEKRKITIRHLITHTSGLPPFNQYFFMDSNEETRIDSVLKTLSDYAPGDTTVYSDIGLISLGKLIEAVSGETLDDYVQKQIFLPLGMVDTGYNPSKEKLPRIVPTEISLLNGNLIHGYVHDENSYSMGGVTGHAGLFSTAEDLSKFSYMMLNKGMYNSTKIFKPETVELFTKRVNITVNSSRCLGWDSPSGRASGGVYLSDMSFGHTGYTGTSLWIDPKNKIVVILLTNAVHPHRSWKSPKYYQWRQRIHSAVYEGLGFTEQNPNLEWIKQW